MGCGNQKNRRNLYRISARNVKQHVLSVNKPFYDCVKKDDFSIKLQNYLSNFLSSIVCDSILYRFFHETEMQNKYLFCLCPKKNFNKI